MDKMGEMGNMKNDDTNHTHISKKDEIAITSDASRIFRFKIHLPQLNEEITAFAQYHKFEDKETLKESFEKWIQEEDIQNLIRRESLHLSENNYDLTKCPLHKKIFKSIKYYHIKRLLSGMQLESTEPSHTKSNSEKQTKRKRIKFSKSFIDDIVVFMHNNIKNNDFKPSTYFDKFTCSHEERIQAEYQRIIADHTKNNNQQTKTVATDAVNQDDEFESYDNFVALRVKKLFKNQYFNRFKQHRQQKKELEKAEKTKQAEETK